MKTLRTLIPRRIIPFVLTLMLLGGGAYAEQTRVYSVGVVPQFDARTLQATWQPLLAELSRQSGLRFELIATPSIPAFEEAFAAGQFDFAYMNPYHMLKAHAAQGYQPLVHDHANDLQGVLVVRKDSPITDVKELDGKVVAFPAPNALGASLMIRAELQGKQKVAITPSYVKSHSSVYLNVVTGMAAAGGGVEETLKQQPAEVQEQLRVLYRTVKVSPHPLAAHPRVPAKVAKQVQQALLAMGRSEEGRALLSKVPMREVGEAVYDNYTPLERLGVEPYYVKE